MESWKYLEEIYENGLKSQKGKDFSKFRILSKLTKRKVQIKTGRNYCFAPIRFEISKSVIISFTSWNLGVKYTLGFRIFLDFFKDYSVPVS